MSMNAGIILQGQNPNLVNALSQGTQAATQVNANQRVQQQNQLYRQHGAGIAAGDPNAINALAGFSPQQAIGVNQAHQGMAQTQQTMDFSAEEMGFLRTQAQRESEQYAAGLSADDAAAQTDKITKGLQGAGHFYTKGDKAGYEGFMRQNGLDPAQYPFEQFPAHAAQFAGVLDNLKKQQELGRGPEEFRKATPEEVAQFGVNGQVNTKTGKFTPIKPPAKGMSIVSDGKGGFTFTQGNADGGDKIDPASTSSMIAAIDGILGDPALDYSTGVFEILQNIPGTPMKRFQGRSRQLEGKAFLQAFEGLKGGGQITEIEGAKATQAIGRLDTAQDAGDYRAALTELREILALAESRPQGWVESQEGATPQTSAPQVGTVTDGYVFLGGDPADENNWGAQR